jgi:hypothetical protein
MRALYWKVKKEMDPRLWIDVATLILSAAALAVILYFIFRQPKGPQGRPPLLRNLG